MDESFGSSMERLVQGYHLLNEIHVEALHSPESSPLGTTITGIARDSAEKAMTTEAMVQSPTPWDNPTLWGGAETVREMEGRRQ